MRREVGKHEFPIWLIGDSNPKNWSDKLLIPLDPRHPARHNIWTPIIDIVQDRVYREAKLRIETQNIYIRNAIENPDRKPPKNKSTWDNRLSHEINNLRQLIINHKPILVLTFGAFAFEFANRAHRAERPQRYSNWTTRSLGDMFRERTDGFVPQDTNIIPYALCEIRLTKR